MNDNYCILDCFVDEPACFGVPPFVSPYPRYLRGALIDSGAEPENIIYMTIDALRGTGYTFQRTHKVVFIIGGAVVPGKYLGAKIGTISEIRKTIENNPSLFFVIGGPAAAAFDGTYKNAIAVSGDIEAYAHGFVKGEAVDTLRRSADIARWAVLGADIVKEHPMFPDIICEIETYRGCPRLVHCTFCSEGLLQSLDFRETRDILAEIDSLIKAGVSRFRIGAQTDILQYMTAYKDFKNGFPEPNVSAVIELFNELKNRREEGLIQTLNIDNANPGTIANFQDESAKMLAQIAQAVTPGDTLALGIESFDPVVIAQNNLKVSPKQAQEVIYLINNVCGKETLLPGINLIHGLAGESAESFALNYRALVKIMEAGLLLKRINIRKHQRFPGTPLFMNPVKISGPITKRFEFYRSKIRSEIDTYMLREIYPAGTVIRDLMILEHRDEYSLGKQIASYSIIAKLPLLLKKRSFSDVIVTGQRERSLEVLPSPFDINKLSQKGLEFIPGIGKKISPHIILKRPFKTKKDFLSFINARGIHIDENIIKHIEIKTQAPSD